MRNSCNGVTDATGNNYCGLPVLDAALGRRPNVTIFSAYRDTADGTCAGNYILVTGVGDPHVRALQALEGGTSTGAYNLGNGRGFSVRDVIRSFERITPGSMCRPQSALAAWEIPQPRSAMHRKCASARTGNR